MTIEKLTGTKLCQLAEEAIRQMEYSNGNYWPLDVHTEKGRTTAKEILEELIRRAYQNEESRAPDKYPTIYHQIIERFGRDVQVNKIQEEALELALAINHIQCPTKENTEDALYSELADMLIMMEQAKILFDITRIHAEVTFKLNRFKEKYLSNEIR